MLSQLIHVISSGNKSPNQNNSGTSRIDEAITATIREIGIPQENMWIEYLCMEFHHDVSVIFKLLYKYVALNDKYKTKLIF